MHVWIIFVRWRGEMEFVVGGEFVVGARHTGLSVILSSAALLQLFTQLKLCCVVQVHNMPCATLQSCILNCLHLEARWRTLVFIGIEVSRE